MTIDELKTSQTELLNKIQSLKTKKSKDKYRLRLKEVDRELFDELYKARDKYAEFCIKGIVVDFTSRMDEFLVRTDDDTLLWLSPASDVLSKSWYPNTCCIEYDKGQTVVINCNVEVDFERACLRLLPGEIIGGRVNEEQYNELCKDPNLAFFKYPTGMSGLFAK